MSYWYLAGPMRDLPRYGFDIFFEAARRLRSLGYPVRSPAEHDIEEGFDPDVGLADQACSAGMFRWDFETIMHPDCEGIILLPGWKDSIGVKAEIVVAWFAGKRFMEYEANGPPVGILIRLPSISVEVSVTAA